ncbi:hypothetical protein BDV25DRAFT_150958 [Aspergillus avenaceus]|uniref:Uncharacterized protein n=1 Tax=Aspergillus avenaceus TaxID=36643 RepID=A0A5N6U256_ASPAV|nr:hypothetical protein BDV25DRAFT_150958 [Aspergillus avenaceus]
MRWKGFISGLHIMHIISAIIHSLYHYKICVVVYTCINTKGEIRTRRAHREGLISVQKPRCIAFFRL